jgi:hypothetical protein
MLLLQLSNARCMHSIFMSVVQPVMPADNHTAHFQLDPYMPLNFLERLLRAEQTAAACDPT